MLEGLLEPLAALLGPQQGCCSDAERRPSRPDVCPDCCSRERVSLAQKCLENTQRKVAGFQNSTVYLQWGGRERGELIFQTAHGCQVYRPWVMPGEPELRAFPAHLLPQTHWDARFLSGADSVPSCCMGNVPSGMGFLRPGAPCPASPCDPVLFHPWLSWSENIGLLFWCLSQWSRGYNTNGLVSVAP